MSHQQSNTPEVQDRVPNMARHPSPKKKPYMIEVRWTYRLFGREPEWGLWKKYATREQRDQAFSNLHHKHRFAEFRTRDDNER